MAALGQRVFIDLCRISKLFSSNRLCFPLYNVVSRNLYDKTSLGLEGYEQVRERMKVQFSSMSEKFRSKMNEYVQDGTKNMIFTEDLKNMVHLAEASPEDIALVSQMMLRFSQQNREMRFGNFVFGPIVMRMYHFLNQHEAALEAFNNPDLEGFFDQLISYQILLDLLFVNERYQDVIDTFNKVVDRQTQGARYPKHCVVLVFGALYKQNTPEAMKKALSIWKNLQETGHIPMRRATTFMAALAVNQGAPHVALEILATARNQNYVTVRNLKLMALADVNRPEDCFPILRVILQDEFPDQRRQNIARETLDAIRTSIAQQKNNEFSQEFERLEKALLENQHVVDEPVADQLLSQMAAFNTQNQPYKSLRPQNRLSASWGRHQYRDSSDHQGNYSQRPSWGERRAAMRPGLSELE